MIIINYHPIFVLLDIAQSFLVDLPLPVDQVGRHVHQIQNAVNRLVPILQHELLVLDGSEIDDAVDAIDSARNDVFVVERAKLFLAIFPLHLQQLAHAA